jgi:hypothetical protein
MTSTRLTNSRLASLRRVAGGRPLLTMQSVRDPSNVLDLVIVPDRSEAQMEAE